MAKIVFFFIKMRFFCKKYLVYKEFLVTLRSYSEVEAIIYLLINN